MLIKFWPKVQLRQKFLKPLVHPTPWPLMATALKYGAIFARRTTHPAAQSAPPFGTRLCATSHGAISAETFQAAHPLVTKHPSSSTSINRRESPTTLSVRKSIRPATHPPGAISEGPSFVTFASYPLVLTNIYFIYIIRKSHEGAADCLASGR